MCTEHCGRLEPPDERALLEAFRRVVDERFGFLSADHGLAAGPLTVLAPGAGPPRPDEFRYPFVAVVEFTGDTRPVRLSYGGKDYRLEVAVGDAAGAHHPLDDWLGALGTPAAGATGEGIATPGGIAGHGQELARLLRRHYEAIMAAGELTGTPAGSLGRARDRAQEAFAAGDYAGYVTLMGPFADALTATEGARLRFARSKAA